MQRLVGPTVSGLRSRAFCFCGRVSRVSKRVIVQIDKASYGAIFDALPPEARLLTWIEGDERENLTFFLPFRQLILVWAPPRD